MVPCDGAGERCDARKIDLEQSNDLAFALYSAGQIDGVGDFALQIELQTNPGVERMTRTDARRLLHKFRLISATVTTIEREKAKEAERNGAGSSATSGSRR